MIGLLRFVGLINAAVWFGAAFFFTFSVEPALTSTEVKELIGQNNFPYFSVALGQLVTAHYFHLYLACSIIALLHLTAEWLYFGRYPQRLWLGVLLCLCLVGLVQDYWLQPRLKEWHQMRYTRSEPQRTLAARAYHAWHLVSNATDVLVVVGLAVYLWRVGNPSSSTRFVNTAKFRS